MNTFIHTRARIQESELNHYLSLLETAIERHESESVKFIKSGLKKSGYNIEKDFKALSRKESNTFNSMPHEKQVEAGKLFRLAFASKYNKASYASAFRQSKACRNWRDTIIVFMILEMKFSVYFVADSLRTIGYKPQIEPLKRLAKFYSVKHIKEEDLKLLRYIFKDFKK